MTQEHTPPVARWAQLLGSASAVLAGVLTGGMVLIQGVLVPFWRSAPPAEFRRWFTSYAGHIRRLMIPLGAGAGAVSAAAAAAHLIGRRPRRSSSVAAAVATGGVVAITLTVNEPANARFTSGSLSDAETRDLLRTWARWHSVRVVLGLAAAVAATSALAGRDREPA